MNSRLIPILLAAASLLLAGCLPESKNPLSTPATSRIDSRLEGVFVERKEEADKDTAYWHFHYRGASPGADKKARMTTTLEILGVGHEAKSGLDLARYRALATQLGGHDFLSFIEVGAHGVEQKGRNYSLARYEVNWHGDLRIFLIDSEALAAAIKAGKLRGTVKSRAYDKDVLVTDTTAHLAAFVAASDPAKLFSKKPLVFHRVAR